MGSNHLTEPNRNLVDHLDHGEHRVLLQTNREPYLNLSSVHKKVTNYQSQCIVGTLAH